MFLLWVLVLVAFGMVLRLRTRVEELEGTVRQQQDRLQDFAEQLRPGPVAPPTPPPVPVAPLPPVQADEQPPATVVPPPVPVFQSQADTQPEPEPFIPGPEPI